MSFSLLDQRAARGLGPFCAEHGVHLLAYGTLAGGWLTERWLGAPEPDWERLSTWSQMKYGRFLRVAGGWSALQRVLQAAAAVAARHGVSIANVASRFILDQPGVAGVIIGARLGEREHIDDTLRLFSLALTDDDRCGDPRRRWRRCSPIPGDCGDEYRKPPFLTASGDLSHHLDSMPAPYQTVPRDGGRTLCLSGTTWETLAGFARAVRQGRRISVSGTTATMGDRVIGGSDPAAQAHFVIDKIEGALQSLGAHARRRDPHARLRPERRRLGARRPRARRALRRDSARQHAGRRRARGRRVPGRDRSGGRHRLRGTVTNPLRACR